MPQGIELADFIQQLRAELNRALHQGSEDAIKFECGPIEIEMTVSVERVADAGAKLRFWLVDADASARLGTTRTQRIGMTLTPREAAEPHLQLHISGETVDDEQ